MLLVTQYNFRPALRLHKKKKTKYIQDLFRSIVECQQLYKKYFLLIDIKI